MCGWRCVAVVVAQQAVLRQQPSRYRLRRFRQGVERRQVITTVERVTKSHEPRRWPMAFRSLEGIGDFVERVALMLEKLRIRFLPTIERHPHLPRSREHLRILDGHLVVDVVRSDGRVALDHVQRVAVEIPGAVEPVSSLKCTTSTTNVSPSQRPRESPIHQSIGPRRMCGAIRVDVRGRVHVLMNERHGDVSRCLENLERRRHVHDAGHAGQEALGFRIRGRAVGDVLLFLLRGPWLVGDDVALDDTLPAGTSFCASGPECPRPPC